MVFEVNTVYERKMFMLFWNPLTRLRNVYSDGIKKYKIDFARRVFCCDGIPSSDVHISYLKHHIKISVGLKYFLIKKHFCIGHDFYLSYNNVSFNVDSEPGGAEIDISLGDFEIYESKPPIENEVDSCESVIIRIDSDTCDEQYFTALACFVAHYRFEVYYMNLS